MTPHDTLYAVSPDGTRLAYDIAGEGKPVLLIHGFASSREQNWRAPGWYDRLKQGGFKVVGFDCRGHGLSDKPHDPAAYGANMVEDIIAVMDAAGLKAADVMGYSMGAMLTVHMAMQHPERVRRAVLGGLGENYFREQQSWRDMIAEALLTDDPNTLKDRHARRFRLFSGQKGKDRLALAACMRLPRQRYEAGELKASMRPVLVAVGEKDDIAGSPYPLSQAFADGRAVLLPGKDHMSAVGDAGYKHAVLAFLGE